MGWQTLNIVHFLVTGGFLLIVVAPSALDVLALSVKIICS